MTYNATGDKVVDSTGKEWPVEVWHPAPVPTYDRMLVELEFSYMDFKRPNDPTHWLVRRRLPDPPKPKTQSQDELDREAFDMWSFAVGLHDGDVGFIEAQTAWQAALAYARKT